MRVRIFDRAISVVAFEQGLHDKAQALQRSWGPLQADATANVKALSQEQA